MVKIPNKKEFITISLETQYLRHWDAEFAPADKFNNPSMLSETRIIPDDNNFFCISALTDVDTTKPIIWATGFYSKYLLEFDWVSKTPTFYDMGIPIESFGLSKNYMIVLSNDGSSTFKFDLTSKTKTHSYPNISKNGRINLTVWQ